MRAPHLGLISPAVLLASFAALAPPAGAQSGAAVLPEVTVTATRAPRPIEQVPQTVQVIERREIQQQLQFSPSASAALARLVPGYSVSNQTVSGASETFRGRDLLVLLDGVPLNTPLRDVSRIVALIDLNAVDRIEVAAGASSLYGAGATGGTVNFITRRPTDGAPIVTINTALRAFTTNVGQSLAPEVSASVTGAVGAFDYTAVGTVRSANRTFDGAGRELPSDPMLGQGGSDRFVSGNAFARIGYNYETRRLEASFTQLSYEQRPDFLSSYSPPFARPDVTQRYTGLSVLEDTQSFQLRYTDSATALGGLSIVGFYNDVRKRFNFTTYSFPYNSQVYYSGTPLSPTSPANQTELNSQRFGANATIDTPLDALWAGARITWGGDVFREETRQELTDGRDVFTPLGQTTLAGFGLLQVPLTERLTVRGGMRYEHFALTVDDFIRPTVFAGASATQVVLLPQLRVTGGSFDYSAPTFNLGATYRVVDNTDLFAGFSQGYALPDVGAFTRRAGAQTTAQALFYACPLTNPGCLPVARQTISYATIGPEAQLVDNYEIGVRGRVGALRFSLSGFISTSDQGVNFDPATNTISQAAERIYGAEFFGEAALSPAFTLGTTMSYREGRTDTNGDGALDSYLANNRIATPFRATVYGVYRFENDWTLRVEGEGFSGRNVATSIPTPTLPFGTRNPIEGGFTINAALNIPWNEGTLYIAGTNLFDTAYENPTATATRNLPVYAQGRTVTVGYRRTF